METEVHLVQFRLQVFDHVKEARLESFLHNVISPVACVLVIHSLQLIGGMLRSLGMNSFQLRTKGTILTTC